MRLTFDFDDPRDAYAEALRTVEEWRESGDNEAYLHFAGLGLETVPPEVFQLTELKHLILLDNKLTTLPSEIGRLKKLKMLLLGNNRIACLPPEIGQLKMLADLDLNHNELTTLPPELFNLTGLTLLDLGGNRLTAVPPEIGRLVGLKELRLGGNHLTTLPSSISNLTALHGLYLPSNHFSTLPEVICQLKSLGVLYLTNNQLTALPPEIGELTALESLDVPRNLLTTLPTEIGQLTALNCLDVDENLLTTLPTELGQVKGLRSLHAEKNRLTELPSSLGALTKCDIFVKKNPLPSELLKLANGGGRKLLSYLRYGGAEPAKDVYPAWDGPPVDHAKLKRFRRSKYFDLERGYEDVMAAAKPAFSILLKGLIELPENASKESRLELFQECMDYLNTINIDSDVENLIETEEREYFCDLLEQIAVMAGLDSIDEILVQLDA